MNYKEYDLAVLGASEAGCKTALAAAKNGLKVAIVDENLLGGVQKMIVEMPTGELLENLPDPYKIEKLKRQGAYSQSELVDGELYSAALQEAAEEYSEQIVTELKNNGVDIYLGWGTVRPNHTLSVTREDVTPRTFKWKKLVYAKEPVMQIPSIARGELGGFYTSDNYGLLSETPEELLIYGEGLNALRAALLWSALGSKINLVSPGNRIAPELPEEIEEKYTALLKEKGTDIYLNVVMRELYHISSGYFHTEFIQDGQEKSLVGDELMILFNPTANRDGIESLGLPLRDGWIVTDESFQTENEDVYTWTASKKRENASAGAVAQFLGDILAGKDSSLTPNTVVDYGLNPPYFELGNTRTDTENSATEKFRTEDTAIDLIYDPRYGELLGARVFGSQAREITSILAMIIGLEGSLEEYEDYLLTDTPASKYVRQTIENAYRRNM